MSGWIAIGAGIIAFLVRESFRSDLDEHLRHNPNLMLQLAADPDTAEGVRRLMDWSLYIGIGLLALGVFYLARGFKEPPAR